MGGMAKFKFFNVLVVYIRSLYLSQLCRCCPRSMSRHMFYRQGRSLTARTHLSDSLETKRVVMMRCFTWQSFNSHSKRSDIFSFLRPLNSIRPASWNLRGFRVNVLVLWPTRSLMMSSVLYIGSWAARWLSSLDPLTQWGLERCHMTI